MEYLSNHCSGTFVQYSSVLLTLFAAGVVGGFTHCAGMCGPFVVAQVANKFDDMQVEEATILRRLGGAALLPYHLGRMTTYAFLGAIAALLSRQIIGSPLEKWVAASLLVVAGLIFMASALPAMKARFLKLRFVGLQKLAKFLSGMAKPLLVSPSKANGYMLGVLLGFLPCGLVFAALMVVSVSASPITAAAAMVLFTIGTFPALFAVGFSSQFAYKRWPEMARKLARFVMVFNGLSLFAIATKMIL